MDEGKSSNAGAVARLKKQAILGSIFLFMA
jgi:hypothetical protein